MYYARHVFLNRDMHKDCPADCPYNIDHPPPPHSPMELAMMTLMQQVLSFIGFCFCCYHFFYAPPPECGVACSCRGPGKSTFSPTAAYRRSCSGEALCFPLCTSQALSGGDQSYLPRRRLRYARDGTAQTAQESGR